VSDAVNVAVLAPNLGTDLSYVTDVDRRVRVLDLNGTGGVGEEADRLLADAEVLLLGFPVLPDLGIRAPKLRWAHHTQAGVSNLLRTDLWRMPSIVLTSSRGQVGTTTIAEYAVAGMFHFARGLDTGTEQHHAGTFSRDGYRMASLRGATVGVVGLGGIGREVARIARGVGMRVVATRHSLSAPDHDDPDAEVVLPMAGLHELVAQSDYVVICSQLTPETRGMVDASVLAAMKDGAVLVNIARGEEIDEDALLEAVRSGRLRGALLDVYDGETLGQPPRPELFSTPGILLTPHISPSGDREMGPRLRAFFADNLRRYLAGEPLLNVVDRDRGY
jgi:phosphoglycerate dehydrogenase-like enzyme